MSDPQPSTAELLLEALMITLLKRDVVTEGDLIAAAERVADLGGSAEEAGHLVNCAIMRASLPVMQTMAERRAEKLRAHIRVVPDVDGGKSEP